MSMNYKFCEINWWYLHLLKWILPSELNIDLKRIIFYNEQEDQKADNEIHTQKKNDLRKKYRVEYGAK